MNVVISAVAEDDMDDIWKYISADNPEAASELIFEFKKLIFQLSDSPFVGSPRSFGIFDVRIIVHKRYVIIYEVEENINVLRILHGARDIETFFE